MFVLLGLEFHAFFAQTNIMWSGNDVRYQARLKKIYNVKLQMKIEIASFPSH